MLVSFPKWSNFLIKKSSNYSKVHFEHSDYQKVQNVEFELFVVELLDHIPRISSS